MLKVLLRSVCLRDSSALRQQELYRHGVRFLSSTSSPSPPSSPTTSGGVNGYSAPIPPATAGETEKERDRRLRNKVIVFGGNGFVGSHICKAAVEMDCDVVSISRSGKVTGKRQEESWVTEVQWVAGDLFEPTSYEEHLEGAIGAVHSVGAFGKDDFMEKVCGDSAVVACEQAYNKQVENFVFISAAGVGQQHLLLRGYFRGKRKAENAIRDIFGDRGVILRASAVYGDRTVGGLTVPLGLVMKPMEMALKLPPFNLLAKVGPFEAAFSPPISVEVLARAAARGALGQIPGGAPLNVEAINKAGA